MCMHVCAGDRFTYNEAMLTRNWLTAWLSTFALWTFSLLAILPPTRCLLRKIMRKPGQGPSREALKKVRACGRARTRAGA